jgi:hypothetical protein
MITGESHAINPTALETSERSKETKHGPSSSSFSNHWHPSASESAFSLLLPLVLAVLDLLLFGFLLRWLIWNWNELEGRWHRPQALVGPSSLEVPSQSRPPLPNIVNCAVLPAQIGSFGTCSRQGHALAKATVMRLLATPLLPPLPIPVSSTAHSRDLARLPLFLPWPGCLFSESSSFPLSSSSMFFFPSLSVSGRRFYSLNRVL